MGPITYIDADGTIAPTWGEQKEGMRISCKGIWGYAPLIISLTANFDRWACEVDFLFGMDAHPTLAKRAAQLNQSAWRPLQRREKYATLTAATRERYQSNEKERIVVEREYVNLRLNHEDVAEFAYRPGKRDKATGWWHCARTSAR